MKLYLLKKVLISTAIIIFASISSTQKTLAEPPQKTYAIAPFISDKEIKWGTLYKNSGDFKALGGLEIMSDITTVFNYICSSSLFSSIEDYNLYCDQRSTYFPTFVASNFCNKHGWECFEKKLDDRFVQELIMKCGTNDFKCQDDRGYLKRVITEFKRNDNPTDNLEYEAVTYEQLFRFSPIMIMGVPYTIELEFGETRPEILSYWHLKAMDENVLKCKKVHSYGESDENYNFCEYPTLLTNIFIEPNNKDFKLIDNKISIMMEEKYGKPEKVKYSYKDRYTHSTFTIDRLSGQINYKINDYLYSFFDNFYLELADRRLLSRSGDTEIKF